MANRVVFFIFVFSACLLVRPVPDWTGKDDSIAGRITRLKSLNLTTVLCDGRQPKATIVIPEDDAYRALAEEINACIRKYSGVVLPVTVNGLPADLLPGGHVIAVGNLANNPFIEKLYFQWLCFTDRWYPGEGGYEIRSIHNPYGTGTNVILIGGSDEKGASEAVRRFCSLLERSGSLSVGWLLELRLGRNLNLIGDKEHTPPLLRLFVEGLEMPLGYNKASRLALMYYYTGDARYARAFLAAARESRLFSKADHYHAHHNALIWDLIEESPLFTDEDRLFITNEILLHALSGESGGGIDELSGRLGELFDRHAGFIGLCALTDVRYLDRDYPSPEWTKILSAVDAYFKPHLGSFASGSDLARGIYTYLEALLIYSLLTGNNEIVRSGALRHWADRCVAMCDPLGFLVPSGQYDETSYPYFTLRKAAYLLRDPGLLYVAEMRRRAGERQGVYELGMEFDQGQAFAGDLEPSPPDNLAGVHVVPLDPREGRFFDPSFPPAKAFAKITFRTGFGENDQFLLLDGIWGGPPGKPIQDAGSILQFTDGGHTFIVNIDPETQNKRSNYVHHNVLSVTLNGEAPEPPRLAALEAAADLPSIGWTHVRLDPYMNGRWDRHIVWRKGGYFFLCDIFRAAQGGVFSLESQWRILGMIEIDENGFSSTTGKLISPKAGPQEKEQRRLEVKTVWYPVTRPGGGRWPVRQCQIDISSETVSRQYAQYAAPLISRLRPTAVLRLEKGRQEEIGSLFYVTSNENPRRHSIVRLDDCTFLVGGNEPAWVCFPEGQDEFARGPLAVRAKFVWVTARVVATSGLTRLEASGRTVLSASNPIDAEWDLTQKTCTLKLGQSTDVSLIGSGSFRLEPGEHYFQNVAAPDHEIIADLAMALARDAAAFNPKFEATPGAPVDDPLSPALSAPLLPPAHELLPGSAILDLKINRDENDAVLLAGCEDGRVIRMDGRGRIVWEFKTGSPVCAVEIAELSPGRRAALAGSDDECIYALDFESGTKIWSHRAEVYPETQAYPWWTLDGKAKVRSILAADFDEDRRAEIAIGTGGMQVEMLNSEGLLLWRSPVMYGLPMRLSKLRPPSGGSFRLLVGLDVLASQSNIFSFLLGGEMESSDAFPSGREGWDYSGISAITWADEKDGGSILAVARSGAYNEVWFYDPLTHRALGTTRVGDTISGLIWLSANGLPAAVAATEAGWVIALKPDGKPIWSVPLPDSIIKLWPAAKGRVVAYCRSGNYFILDLGGHVLSRGQGSWPSAMVQTVLNQN